LVVGEHPNEVVATAMRIPLRSELERRGHDVVVHRVPIAETFIGAARAAGQSRPINYSLSKDVNAQEDRLARLSAKFPGAHIVRLHNTPQDQIARLQIGKITTPKVVPTKSFVAPQGEPLAGGGLPILVEIGAPYKPAPQKIRERFEKTGKPDGMEEYADHFADAEKARQNGSLSENAARKIARKIHRIIALHESGSA